MTQASARPLLPAACRRPAVASVVLSVSGLVLLGVRYHDETSAARVDRWVLAHLPRVVRLHPTALTVVADAVPALVAVVAVTLAVVFGLTRAWKAAVLSLCAPVLTVLAAELGKHLVNRRIDGGLALPSGHTAAATSILLVLAVAVLRRTTVRVLPFALVLALGVTAGAAVVALAMVSLRFHYATDTVGGFCTGVAVTLGSALALDSLAPGAGLRRRAPGGRRPGEAAPLSG